MHQDSSFYNQDSLNQIPLDLLSYTLPQHDGHLTPDQEFPNTFFSNLNEENNSSGVTGGSAPVPSQGLSDFYNYNVSHVSPLDVSFFPQSSLSTPLPTPNYCTPSTHPLQDDVEEFLTPLVSPAITPNYTDIYEYLDPPNEQHFTPLSSPALPPSNNNSLGDISSPSSSLQNAALLSQQLAQIEAKQQMLRDQLNQSPTSPTAYRKSPLALFSNRKQAPPSPLSFSGSKKRPSLRQKIALASPQLHSSQNHHISLPTTPATPASLMKMSHQQRASSTSPAIALTINNTFTNNNTNTDMTTMVDIMPSLPPTAYTPPINDNPTTTSTVVTKNRKLAPSSPVVVTSSPRTLKSLISPFLQPDLKTVNPITSFTPGIENRRSAHKVAEQRRRDTLKQSFDSLRKEIVDVLVMDTTLYDNNNDKSEEIIRSEKEKEVKLMSKVLLLQHSYEYIIRLKNDGKLKDEKMEKMQSELDELKQIAASANNNTG